MNIKQWIKKTLQSKINEVEEKMKKLLDEKEEELQEKMIKSTNCFY